MFLLHTVVHHLYFDAGNTQQSKIFNAPDQESNTSTDTGLRMTVDVWGRITEITEFPIVTAYEGTKAAAWSSSTTYLRYEKVTNSGRLYQAGYGGVSAGQTAPTPHERRHRRRVARPREPAETPVKGLASFDQEDFDVDSTGHVTIADKAIDNTQLQNPIFGFSDGNTLETFQLDAEQTASTGYRGFNYLNYLMVNDTSGNALFHVSNSLPLFGGAAGMDINVPSIAMQSDMLFDADASLLPPAMQSSFPSGYQSLSRTQGTLNIDVNANDANLAVLQLYAINAGIGDGIVALQGKLLLIFRLLNQQLLVIQRMAKSSLKTLEHMTTT